jgi:signal transduction histidine kinase
VSGLRLVHFGSDAVFATAIRDVLAAQLPDCASEALDPEKLKSRPAADAVIIDARPDFPRGAALAARLRAMGFAGAIVVISDAVVESDPALAPTGAARLTSREIADQLIPRLAEQLALAGSEHAQQVMRARKLVAAGEIAGRFQHSLNNPLAGILAEAQLMQLDSLQPEQHAALERIVGLCRRIIELGRSLDGMGERK